jgi:multicomponent Na+:H+ antiporter subunit C
MTLPAWMPYALCGSALVGLGLYGLLTHPRLLRRILAFNVIGSGIFLLFGALARRGATSSTDPVPQAMIITGIVVALSATALALALIVAHAGAGGGEGLPEDPDEQKAPSDRSARAADAQGNEPQ